MIFKLLTMFSAVTIINQANLWEYAHSYALTTAQGNLLILKKSS